MTQAHNPSPELPPPDVWTKAVDAAELAVPFFEARRVDVEAGLRAALYAINAAGYSVVPTGETEHVVRFDRLGWTLRHPLACRPNLFDCRVNRAANAQLHGPPAAGLGEYRIAFDAAGCVVLLEPVT